jgi:hypothetical protein
MAVWLNAITTPWTGTEGVPENEIPSSQQIAIANLALAFAVMLIVK